MKHHHAVVHPDVLIARAETEFHGLLALNDRLLNWMAAHVLPSMLMFDMALVLPLLVIPAPDGVKILVGLLSGSWFQWWALTALQRTANVVQAQNDAKAEVDHTTLSYLAHIQDEQLAILKRLDAKESI